MIERYVSLRYAGRVSFTNNFSKEFNNIIYNYPLIVVRTMM